MKKIFLSLFVLLVLAACKDEAKEKIANLPIHNIPISNDEIEHEVLIDKNGERMEVTKNISKNKITVKLNGEVYELSKNAEGPGYSTNDSKYYFVQNKKETKFKNKNIDMVLFHCLNTKKSSSIAAQ